MSTLIEDFLLMLDEMKAKSDSNNGFNHNQLLMNQKVNILIKRSYSQLIRIYNKCYSKENYLNAIDFEHLLDKDYTSNEVIWSILEYLFSSDKFKHFKINSELNIIDFIEETTCSEPDNNSINNLLSDRNLNNILSDLFHEVNFSDLIKFYDEFNKPNTNHVSGFDDDTSNDKGNFNIKRDFEKYTTLKSSEELIKSRSVLEKYEKDLIRRKTWEMSGEIEATRRPLNSLLETTLEHVNARREAPICTQKTQMQLDDFVISRVIQSTFDNGKNKVKPFEDHAKFKKTIVLPQEKSNKSLAQIYEDEYTKQLGEEITSDVLCTLNDEKAPKQINDSFGSVIDQLDSLSNCHFTPNYNGLSAIIRNTPAACSEELTHEVINNNTSKLAPEEIAGSSTKILVSKDELTRSEKKLIGPKKHGIPCKNPIIYNEKDVMKIKEKRGRPYEILIKNQPMIDKAIKRKRVRVLKKANQ